MRTIDFASCSSPANRARCIQMIEGTPILPGACAQIVTPTGADGITNNVSTLTVATGWTSWNSAFVQRTINHELTHPFGLTENGCNYTGSLMTPITCGQSGVGSYTLPTLNELIPIAQTVYGGGSRQTCF